MALDRVDSTTPLAHRIALVRWASLFYAALLAVAWLWTWLAGRPLLRSEAGAAIAAADLLGDAGLGLLAGAAVLGLSHLATRRTAWGERLARSLGRLLGPLSTRQCVWLALVSGLGEEALFRGALQPQVGLVPASLLFAAAHFVPSRELWPWTLFALGAGLLLGALFELTGNLLAPVLAHALINAVNLRLLSRRYGWA